MTQVIYTCPQCGGTLWFKMIATNPPIEYVQCSECGWFREEKNDGIIEIPYGSDKSSFNTNSACKKCRNNPANGGSGICHCILGTNTIY